MPEIGATRFAGQRARLVQAHDSTGALSPLIGKKEARTAIRCDRLIAAACLMKGGDAEVRNEKALDCLC